jgi:xanthine dehydrogenase YagT iron-sulfur-binding subunit
MKQDGPDQPLLPEDPAADQRGATTGLSRRTFLRGGAAVGALGTVLLRAEPVPAAPAPHREEGAEILGPGPVPVRLQINGQVHELELEPRVTLLDALRDHLQMTGAKRVCDRGTCGACTVQMAGRPVYACSVLALEAEGTAITTIESLASGTQLHPLQAAFVENDAQQCGFCTPGFVMAAKSLLDRVPAPKLEDLEHGLAGNFCRCGTYAGIRRAVLSLANAEPRRDDHG